MPPSENNLKKTFAALALAALIPLASAHAATISFSNDKALTKTNWTDTLSFGKFDTSLGTLTSIRFDLSGLVEGNGRAESEDSEATTVTLTLASLLGLKRPDGSTLVVTNPVFSQVFSFAPSDDVLDFAGQSGGSTGTVRAGASDFFISTSASDFALFSGVGGGMINLGVNAIGTSNATGSGNLVSGFRTAAAANVKVSYDYTPFAEVPEPAGMTLILAGLGLLGLSRRRIAKR